MASAIASAMEDVSLNAPSSIETFHSLTEPPSVRELMVTALAIPMKRGGVLSWTIVMRRIRGAVKPKPPIALKMSPSVPFVPDMAKPMMATLKKVNPATMGHLTSFVLVTSGAISLVQARYCKCEKQLTQGHEGAEDGNDCEERQDACVRSDCPWSIPKAVRFRGIDVVDEIEQGAFDSDDETAWLQE